MRVLLVTGGAGFIGSNFIKWFLRRNRDFIVVNIDKITYAGNPNNLRELENSPRYHYVKGDISNHELVNYIFMRFKPSFVINFAAESHVDRSITHPSIFVQTNVLGTITLLESARYIWGKRNFEGNRFIQVSTDEVYGSTNDEKSYFSEDANLMPGNPYSASKAGADLIIQSYSNTYKMPVIITRCCNNYGPNQHPEKFIPKCITNALQNKPIPLYGDGLNIREWIYVFDHCMAITRALFYGKPGEIYNIGTGEGMSNIELAKRILKLTGKSEDAIEMVNDRPGHDRRYALNSYKIRNNLNWAGRYKLEDGLKETVNWYKDNM
jgi:dTDP-glucose 4,6-dehydratase